MTFNKKHILFFFLIILGKGINLHAQNLVPNQSFENYIYCPSDYHEFYQLLNWTNPSSASPSIFNNCSMGNATVPINIFGYQFAHTGNGYVGISVFNYSNNDNYREYIQIELTQNLIANKKYLISFFVSLADSSKYAVNNLGAYISNVSISENTISVINYIPQIQNISSNLLIDKINWIEIKGSYQAIGGERYISIGNFNYDEQLDTVLTGGPFATFYYIDDVFVGLDTITNIDNNTSLDKYVKVYPNPAISKIIIENINNLQKEIIVGIFNITGQQLMTDKLKNQNSIEFDISSIAKGMYILTIQIDDKIENKKLIIQ